MSNTSPIRIGFLGAGTVGANCVNILHTDLAELSERADTPLEISGVVVRDPAAERVVPVPTELITTDAENVVTTSDIVVELIGGLEPARTLILQAMAAGADVVTANKALLATHGTELFAAAQQAGVQLNYEAAVAGAIPIIRPLRDSLAGDRVTRLMGIVNGTTNYILDRMDREGADFDTVLAQAQQLGYAEADPTADIEGFDAAQKAAIMSSLAFHTPVPLSAVHREGISTIDANAVEAARAAGYVIKLLAVCERLSDNETALSVRVAPTLIPRSHPLASVHGANNAVFVEADAAGSLMFYGAGAGGPETASAVLGDVIATARRRRAGGHVIAESMRTQGTVVDIAQVTTRYQVTLEVVDQPGVLATVAGILSDSSVSIATVEQTAARDGVARIVIGTHRAKENNMVRTVAHLESSSVVARVEAVLRVEGD